jgi:hypothetical protein
MRRLLLISLLLAGLSLTLGGQQLQTGTWELRSAAPWSACVGGTEVRDEVWGRIFNVLDGTTLLCSCEQTEPRIGSRPCGSVLLQKADLTYLGAFQLPAGSDSTYGGTALTYWPAHQSLLVVGHDWYQRSAEITIPTPGTGSTVASLPRSAFLQGWTDILQGKRNTVDGTPASGTKIGGHLVIGSQVLVSVWTFYDNNPGKLSHFWTGQLFSSLTPSAVTGPYQVGLGFPGVPGTSSTAVAGVVSGYMTAIPSQWQTLLNGTYLTGNGGYVSIVTRTNMGPGATVFTPSDVGSQPVEGMVVGYPPDHATLGVWGQPGGIYNGTQGFRGMTAIDGTASLLYWGWTGTGPFCYGAGTNDPNLNLKPLPPPNQSQHYCYDPVNASTGTHGYPYASTVWAYDMRDLVKVRAGQMKPWDVKPYATWTFTLPFQSRLQNGVEVGVTNILGAAYDPGTKRIYVTSAQNGTIAPLVHAFTLP